MNRVELVEKIVAVTGGTKADAVRALSAVTESIIAAVKRGESVQVVGFGTFKLVSRAARTGINPATKAPLKIPAQKIPKFVPGSAFKDAVDPKAAKRRAAKKAG